MKVLIVSTNKYQQPIPVMPLGACMVAEAAKNAGHEVTFLDFMFASDPEMELRKNLSENNFDVVGLSFRNLDNNEIQNPLSFVDQVVSFTRLVRETSSAQIVLGGAAVGMMPTELLKKSSADFVVLGYGETIFPQILEKIETGTTGYGISGVITRSTEGMDNSIDQSGDYIPLVPNFNTWIDTGPYTSMLASAPVQTKRGCPYDCIYCTYPAIEGKSFQLVSPEKAVRNVTALVEQGFENIEFVDNVFNSPHDHAVALCNALIAERLPARYQTLELNPAFVDDTLIAGMKRAGFVGAGITPESASDRVLESLGKNYGSSAVRRAAEVVKRHDLKASWFFMAGGPGETRQTIQESLEFVEKFVSPRDLVMFNVGIRIYPRTRLEVIAKDLGFITDSTDLLQPVFFVSPEIDLEWLQSTLFEFSKSHLNFITGDALAHPLLRKILPLARILGFQPPLWRYTREIRRITRFLGLYH
jgi:radical SAM superfamily enzyme YgiQ (UPF0313 family)